MTRKEFIAEFDHRELVQASINQDLVYNVLKRGPDESIGKVQVVWTPEGRCANGAVYENVDETSISKFDPIGFLNA